MGEQSDKGGEPLGGIVARFTLPAPVDRHVAALEAEVERRRARVVLRPAIETIPIAWRECTDAELERRLGSRWDLIGPTMARRPWSQGVTLFGPSGRGKTTLGVAILVAWLRHASIPLDDRARGGFVSARTVGTATRAELVGLDRAPMLMLDDVGAEVDSVLGRAAVADLIAERHAWSRPTIVTTWLDERATASKYGDGIARRLFDRTIAIDFNGGR